MLKGSGEKPAGGRQVPLLRHQHVDDLPDLVDRAVEGDPPPGNLDIRFISEPPVTRGVPAGACRINQQRNEPLHPVVDGDVIRYHATLS